MRQAARITIGQAVADLKAEFPDVDIKESKIRHLENEGLVEPERTPSGYRKYSVEDMEKLRYIIRAQREHYLPLKVIREHLDALDRGLEPRHLRAFRTAAEREVGLVEQVVSPIRRSREDGAEGRAAQTMDEMAVLSIRLHAALVKSGLRSLR